MVVGERLRAFREYKVLSQSEMEQRLGLSRYYISRVENGHTIPTLETLGRFARALEVPLFHLVYEEQESYQPPIVPKSTKCIEPAKRLSKRDSRLLKHFNLLFGQLCDRDKQLLVGLAHRMAIRVCPGATTASRKRNFRSWPG